MVIRTRSLLAQVICYAMTCFALATADATAATSEVRLKDLGRFLGWRENMLVGYGIVSGLANSGDSTRSQATRQALSNMLSQFDMTVTQDQIQSRNVALVMVTGTLPPTADVGDRIDINVTSMGDARSLAGGTLILTSLRGPDRKIYALAQGPLSVGGYRYDANGNSKQKNHPTAGVIPLGATIEVPVRADLVTEDGRLRFVLNDADSSTAQRVAQRINQSLGGSSARSLDDKTIEVSAPQNTSSMNEYVARIEDLAVAPDQASRVVINERTGTVVSGGDTRISPITISHGDIRVSVVTEYQASQPTSVELTGSGVRSLVIGNTDLSVEESGQAVAASLPNGTVGDLVRALAKARVSTRDVISILQAIKAAGALYADLIIQ